MKIDVKRGGGPPASFRSPSFQSLRPVQPIGRGLASTPQAGGPQARPFPAGVGALARNAIAANTRWNVTGLAPPADGRRWASGSSTGTGLFEARRLAAFQAGIIDEDGRPTVTTNESGEPVRSWPHDDTGYAITKKDLDVIGLTEGQVDLWRRFKAPLGMTEKDYEEFTSTLKDALAKDGLEVGEVDIRLQGSSAHFFSGRHKNFPTRETLSGPPEAKARLESWVGERPPSEWPARIPFDGKYKITGNPEDLSDYDVQLSSGAMIGRAKERWDKTSGQTRGHKEFINPKYNFADKRTVSEEFGALTRWAETWRERIGREVSVALFTGTGPPDTSGVGTGISTHFRPSDWIIKKAGEDRDA